MALCGTSPILETMGFEVIIVMPKCNFDSGCLTILNRVRLAFVKILVCNFTIFILLNALLLLIILGFCYVNYLAKMYTYVALCLCPKL